MGSDLAGGDIFRRNTGDPLSRGQHELDFSSRLRDFMSDAGALKFKTCPNRAGQDLDPNRVLVNLVLVLRV